MSANISKHLQTVALHTVTIPPTHFLRENVVTSISNLFQCIYFCLICLNVLIQSLWFGFIKGLVQHYGKYAYLMFCEELVWIYWSSMRSSGLTRRDIISSEF